ncbi:MAG: thiamine phosphate synthase [Candidatus Rokubacteria bacterium]|nr:thiamine phosphate synthase [Candidatus Rokubacteria bacterium]
MDLYVILDPAASGGRDPVTVADAVLAAGARWVQLRDKTASTRALAGLARCVGARVRAAGGVFIVNDRLDVALAAGADGVHLGQDDLPPADARAVAPGLVLGVSTHSLDQARRAQDDGADYVALGSIFATGSKPSFELVGLEALPLVRPHVTVPLVAVGGITVERVPAVLAAGADAVAVISAIGMARDPGEAAAAFLAAIRQARRLEPPRGSRA